MAVTLTHEQLVALYWHPFPPEEGYLYAFEALEHWVLQTMAPAEANGGFMADAGRNGATRHASRSLALTRAAGAVVNRAAADQRVAEDLDDGAADVIAKTNASRIAAFVDRLLESPPVCDVIPPLPPPFPFPGIPIVIVIPPVSPPPVPPEWQPGEDISAYDLFAVGARFKTAAELVEPAVVRAELEIGADRLFEAAQMRLG